MKRKRTFWDTLSWIVLGLIALWLILKTVGVINTPLWLELAPLYGFLFVAGKAMRTLETVSDDVSFLKKDVRRVEKELTNNIHILELGISGLKYDVTLLKKDVGILKYDVGTLKSKV
jgi:uncharacterized membrane protein YhdT